jgi:hypothetical protein
MSVSKYSSLIQDVKTFDGAISETFDIFLWHYVAQCEERFTQKLDGFKKSLGQVEEGVYSSSIEMVLSFQALLRESLEISKGQIFQDICKFMKKWFAVYNGLLADKVKAIGRCNAPYLVVATGKPMLVPFVP